jgi:hypothetical protein
MTMTEPTDLEQPPPAQPPAVNPVHVLLYFLEATGGDPFVPVEANATKIFEAMKQGCPGMARDDVLAASRVADELGKQLRRLHWRVRGAGLSR